MRTALNRLYLLSGWTGAVFIALICLLVFAQVLLNLVDRLASVLTGSAIGLSIPSYSDFTGFFLAAASFFALAYTLREGGHIRVSLVIQNFSPRLRHMIEIWCVAAALVVTAYFAWYMGLLVGESLTYNDLSPGIIAVPIWIPQSAVLLGLAVLGIALVDELVMLLKGGKPSYDGKGENLLEGDEPAAGQGVGHE